MACWGEPKSADEGVGPGECVDVRDRDHGADRHRDGSAEAVDELARVDERSEPSARGARDVTDRASESGMAGAGVGGEDGNACIGEVRR